MLILLLLVAQLSASQFLEQPRHLTAIASETVTLGGHHHYNNRHNNHHVTARLLHSLAHYYIHDHDNHQIRLQNTRFLIVPLDQVETFINQIGRLFVCLFV